MKILLVEDSGTMRKMELRLLGQLGFKEVIEAEDGEKAVGILSADPDVKLVISDWAMPNRDGLSLLQWIRSNPATASLPFIMATGQGDKEYVATAKEAGADALVAKPFSPDELKERIATIFGDKSAAPAAPPPPPKEQLSSDGRILLKVAHIQITDHLALGMLRNRIEGGEATPAAFQLETRCLPNWNKVAEALERGDVDAAFILAPAAMDLFRYGVPIRLTLFAHRNGSIMVRNSAGEYRKPYQQFFKHKTFFIPFKMSVHNMLAHKYFSEMGLKPGLAGKEAVNVLFEVVAPVNMPEFLKDNPNACGFMVAEPIGSRAIAAGIAEREVLSSDIWDNHPCCVVVFRDDFIGKHADAVHEFTRLLVESGRLIGQDPPRAAEVAVSFLDPQKTIGLTRELLLSVLTEPKGIRTDDLYPDVGDLEVIQRYMTEKMGIGGAIDLGKFVDTRFADAACGPRKAVASTGAALLGGAVEGPSASVGASAQGKTDRARKTGREGKYLIFKLAEERYGISVLDVKEIIRMMAVTPVPRMPHYFRGVIDLRGKVIPVLDLRSKFGMEAMDYDERTCIVVVEIAGRGGSALVGVVVDAVLEVTEVREEIIHDTPEFAGAIDTHAMLGMARMPGGVTILLDVDKSVGDHGAESFA
jgi:chemotaxis signal transduction protein/CheY-like chemotaxis protein